MKDALLRKLQEARDLGIAHCVATVAQTKGSTPREAGAKMVVYANGTAWGTVGGGKFEALVIQDCLSAIESAQPLLKSYPLRETAAESFGAICGGEVTVLMEPIGTRERLVIVGAGHCGVALAKLARDCGFHVTIIDDREQGAAEPVSSDASHY